MKDWENAANRLRAQFVGAVLLPGDTAYAAARPIWNGMWDHVEPALIAQCAGYSDVRAAVLFAREHDLPAAVRGGGHSAAGKGTCEGGIVIDLSRLRGVHVDPSAKVAVAGGGCLWGDFDREVQLFGLATPGGVISHTGIGGFALGGGFGWLSRRFGLTCDNLLAADLITADGEIVRASAMESPDLFWGLRGGGGNFGVVTHFTMKLHEVGPVVTAGVLMWPVDQAEKAWAAFAELAATAPDEIGVNLAMMTAPPQPFIDESLHNRKTAAIIFCWSGDRERLDAVIAPALAAFPITKFIAQMPYCALQRMFDPMVPHGRRSYWKSGYLKEVGGGAASVAHAFAAAATSPFSQAEFPLMGGAVARVGPDDTAFGDRTGATIYNVVANWTDVGEDEPQKAWARSFFDGLEPFSTSTVYVNFLGEEGADRIRAAYGAEKYDRLAQLKKKYDPENFFRSNQNIQPAA